MITPAHIQHRSNVLVSPCEVFELVLSFRSWAVQTSVRAPGVGRMLTTVHWRQNEDFPTIFQLLEKIKIKRNRINKTSTVDGHSWRHY